MKGQILNQMDDIANARKWYAKGLENCKDSVPLWLLLARLEEEMGNNVKARSVLERARLKNPCNDVLWMESIQVCKLRGDISWDSISQRAETI